MTDDPRDGPQTTELLRVADATTSAAAIAHAAALVRAGKLVAFPTETVYGLGADATSAAAVAGIFRAKGRPHSDPLIVHIAEVGWLGEVAAEVPALALRLAARFWPGPLTLVLPRGERIPPLVTAGGATVGVRLPAHPVARALIAAAGVPIAAPSANRFTHTSPTTAAHVLADLGGRIACVLDGGPSEVGVESTVVDLTSDPPRLLRPGGVGLEALRALMPELAAPPEQAASATEEPARAPGQMERHYAPRARLIAFDGDGAAATRAVAEAVRVAVASGARVGALVSEEEAPALDGLGARVFALGPAGDLAAIARNLYARLRELDDASVALIVTHTFAGEGLGLALRDRLRRAAGGQLTPLPPV
ncbi:MAG TPA: L-threonylcarbamoyladenylate synthase [Ktedonobacterales bacterium]|jgi:L-threonylcarbamoyladenylate synthase